MDYDRTTMLFMTIGTFMMVLGQIIDILDSVFYLGLGWFVSSTIYGFIMERIMSGNTMQWRYNIAKKRAEKNGKKDGRKNG